MAKKSVADELIEQITEETKPDVLRAQLDIRVICPLCEVHMRNRGNVIYCIERTCTNVDKKFKAPMMVLEEV